MSAAKTLPLLLLGLFACMANSAEHRNAKIDKLQATFTDTNCFYFTLRGVSQADAISPGSPWFAISKTQTGAADRYALLLSAKLSDAPVWITTTGALVCGYPSVGYVILE